MKELHFPHWTQIAWPQDVEVAATMKGFWEKKVWRARCFILAVLIFLVVSCFESPSGRKLLTFVIRRIMTNWELNLYPVESRKLRSAFSSKSASVIKFPFPVAHASPLLIFMVLLMFH